MVYGRMGASWRRSCPGSPTPSSPTALAAFLKSLPPVRFAVPRPHGPDAAPAAPYLMAIFPDFRDPFGDCAVAQADCPAAGGDTVP